MSLDSRWYRSVAMKYLIAGHMIDLFGAGAAKAAGASATHAIVIGDTHDALFWGEVERAIRELGDPDGGGAALKGDSSRSRRAAGQPSAGRSGT